MGKREHRRDPRVNVAIDVRLQTAAGSETYDTKDISYRGVFIVCPEPYPLRKLVKFKTVVDDDELQMLGLVAHRINSADAIERGVSPGMGIQLYSVGKATRERWRGFVRDMYERDPEAAAEVRASELPRIRIHLATEEMMKQFMEQDFPSGSIFYRTPDIYPEGTRVICDVSHPTTGETFELDARVSEVVEGSRRDRGMRIDFLEISEASEERLGRFERGESSEAVIESQSEGIVSQEEFSDAVADDQFEDDEVETADETPADEPSADETPADETPADETPADDEPISEEE